MYLKALRWIHLSDKNSCPFQVLNPKTYTKLLFKGSLHQQSNRKESDTFAFQAFNQLQPPVRGNTSTFIYMGVDSARRPAVTSPPIFAVLHIRRGNTEKPLKRLVQPSRSSCLRRSPSALPLMLRVWSRAARHSLPGLAALSDLICSGGTFMWFTPAAPPPSPSQIRVQGLSVDAA